MKRSTVWTLVVVAAGAAAVSAGITDLLLRSSKPATRGFAMNLTSFQPPPDSNIPTGEFGNVVRLGEKIFRDPVTYARQFVGNELRCSNCHLQAGRQAGASPMWAAYTAYPAYRSKNGHVNSFEERLQGCFRYSMNGKVPELGDPVLVALESYSYFLAKGPADGRDRTWAAFPGTVEASVTP
jgi:thiosulfate dehydrogenase